VWYFEIEAFPGAMIKAMHCRLIERPVVLPPPAYYWVVLRRQFGKFHRRLAMKLLLAHRPAHPLQGIVTGSRQETGKYPDCLPMAFLGLNVKPRNEN
jgi:hypothetical protein